MSKQLEDDPEEGEGTHSASGPSSRQIADNITVRSDSPTVALSAKGAGNPPETATQASTQATTQASTQAAPPAAAPTNTPTSADPISDKLTSTATSSGGRTNTTGGMRRQSASELAIGMVLADRYQVLERLSAGGMGVVYKARHVALDDMVALKVLLKPQREEDQKRFLLEARVATKIKHPNTVYISDFGVIADGRSYLAMEFLQGQTLAQAMRKLIDLSESKRGAKPYMDPLRACRIAVQIARGLQAVHDKGIIHRDLKPENVFLLEQDGQPDFVKIVDFGIAKLTRVGGAAPGTAAPGQSAAKDAVAAVQAAEDALSGPVNVTLPGSVMGTPAYMPPEAIDGKNVDVRADQYSLGCVLYELLSGQTPFRSRSSASMLMKHLSEPPPQLRQGALELSLPPSLEALVMRLLSKSPDGRYASMREVEQALQREIDLMLVARGEKTVLPTALARSIAGSGLGAALVLGKWRIPLLALLPLALLLFVAGGLLTYRLAMKQSPPKLDADELLSLRKRALQILLQDLKDPNSASELRLSALSALGLSQDVALRLELEAALKNPAGEPMLRAQAAEALGQLGERAAVSALVPLLSDSNTPVLTAAAAAALHKLGEARGHRTLIELLDSNQPEAQFRAAMALCEQGPAHAREVLRTYLQREGLPDEAWLDIQTCLARAGEDAAKAALQSRMQTLGHPVQRILAAGRLWQLGDRQAREYLLGLVRKKDPDHLLAARMLAGAEESELGDIFRRIVATKQAALPARQLGAEGLGAIGELFDARLLGTLLVTMPNPNVDARLRQTAAAAILQIALHDPSACSERSLAWARGALFDKNWLVRQTAATVLGDSASTDAVSLLAKVFKDADARVRRSAARALGRRKERTALRVLLPGLEDVDGGVRSETLKALGRLLSTLTRQGVRDLASEVGPWLRRIIDKGSPSERLPALGLLARIGDRSQLERLLTFKDTPDPEVRRLFIEQIEGRPDLLVTALDDKDFSVRFAAARKLAERSDARAIPTLTAALKQGGATALIAYGLLAALKAPVPSTEDLLALFEKSRGADRLAAVEAAAKLPLEQALAVLLAAAHDANAEVRRTAAEVAAELPHRDGQPAGRAVLNLLLSDSDEAVRAQAQALLGSLSVLSDEPPPQNSAAEPMEPTPAAIDPSGGDQDAGAAGSETTDLLAPTAAATPSAAAEASSGPDAAAELEGLGLLVLKGPDFVQYQLDGKRWQYLSSKAQKLAPGPHRLLTMGGKQEVIIEEKKTKTQDIPPSSIEEAAHSGIEAYQRKDYGKAQKQLERAYQRCERARGLVQPCANLSAELSFYLAQVHEAQNRPDEAATEYQQVIDATAHGRLTEKQRDTAAQALRSLSQRLGLVIMRAMERGQCKEKKMWLPTGTHRVKFGTERREVKVRARETVQEGSCS